MPSHPVPSGFTRAVSPFTASEWELLVRLPGRVVVAATNAGVPRRTVAEGLAGLEAMAAGRIFDSDLVRAVVAGIYAENLQTEYPTGAADVLSDCRTAAEILRRRADPADGAAYRQWIQSIAARVCAGTASGRTPEQLGPTDRRFLADLGHSLGMR